MADRVPYVIELITRKKPAEKFSINFYWKIDGGKVFSSSPPAIMSSRSDRKLSRVQLA
jgi:hypothetical protein